MRTVALMELGADALEQLAQITFHAGREHSPEWMPHVDAAREQVSEALAPDKTALVLLDAAGQLIAWVAASHAWGRVWELHPLIVAIEHQRRGHGRRLVRELEHLAAAKGALTMVLGTSDSTDATSLSGVDLYNDTFARLEHIELRRSHALEFWRGIGYSIVGVVPDAEGPGKPSISLARTLRAQSSVQPKLMVRDSESERDLAALQGSWEQVDLEADGISNPPDAHGAPGALTTFVGHEFTVRTVDGVLLLAGTFSLDASTRPKSITWIDSMGEDMGKALPAIYALDGDNFVFVAGNEGSPRPSAFTTAPGQTMRTFVRASPVGGARATTSRPGPA